MTERPTPETDAVMRGPGPFRNGATREELRLADFARRLERERDALRAALRELDEATSAAYPAFEVGADAQLAWSDRIDNARRSARALLGHTSPAMTKRYLRSKKTPVVQGPSFGRVSKKAS